VARPIVIAHRGASAHRPEHTLAAYELGIAQGADVIEPDPVATRDHGVFADDPAMAGAVRAAWEAG
jgi:glycerophosphoryl diester phosphodiesterase